MSTTQKFPHVAGEGTVELIQGQAPIRYRWLNALIIGAAITVWLSIAAVLVGIVIGVAAVASAGGDSSSIIDGFGRSCDRADSYVSDNGNRFCNP